MNLNKKTITPSCVRAQACKKRKTTLKMLPKSKSLTFTNDIPPHQAQKQAKTRKIAKNLDNT